jgi:hydrogenase maturation protein HypF
MSNNKRQIFVLSGCVQGVGFRPFVFRLAEQYGLFGHIRNTSRGVSIDVQGEIQALNNFQRDLTEKKPMRAWISKMEQMDSPLHEADHFAIIPSDPNTKTELALLPDTAICAECLQELCNPQDRRYRFPFLHCMSCGPRFSIFLRMPFDRENTTMVDFPIE